MQNERFHSFANKQLIATSITLVFSMADENRAVKSYFSWYDWLD